MQSDLRSIIEFSMTQRLSLESTPILALENITKQFSTQGIPAVSSVSLRLQPGELLALLGPSGCGKTTLLRLIAGFEQPQQGTITIAQQTVASKSICLPPEKRGIGMVFQDYALFPHLTVSQNVAFGLRRKSSSIAAERVQQAIELVNLTGLEHRYPHQLSGGQQQRVALARALAPHPFLVLLDEPLSNLDVQVRLRLRQELREILKGAGTSAIFVTHDQEEALSIADQVGVMQAGCLEQVGTPETIYREPASRFVAEFVTQANFLSARRQGQVWQTAFGDFPISLTANLAANRQGVEQQEQVELMVRPEEMKIQPDETSKLLICDRQFLGREYRYCIQAASGHKLTVRTPADVVYPVGMPIQVELTADSLRVFSATLPPTDQATLTFSTLS